MSVVTTIAVFVTESVRRCASRMTAHTSPSFDLKLAICTKRNGKSPSRHCMRQSAMSAGKTLAYMGANARRLFDSPWYQITPLMAYGVAGATIPLKSHAGAHD